MMDLSAWAQCDPTLDSADAALIELSLREKPRSYLGMSSLGDECSRKLWYRFHTPKVEKFDAGTLKRFADGHASEAVVIERLRRVPGLTLLPVDPKTGRQWRLEDHDGKLAGHMDGVVLGLLQAPRTWHVFEVKATSDKKFAELLRLKERHGEKQALREWNATYYAQAQLYMGYADLTRHYTVVCTAGARDWTSLRTEFSKDVFDYLKDKARRILTARVPLARISNDPNWWACKWCAFRPECHGVVE